MSISMDAKLVKHFDKTTLDFFCRNLRPLKALRDELLREEFNGRNHEELAVKFDIDVRHVYRILARK